MPRRTRIALICAILAALSGLGVWLLSRDGMPRGDVPAGEASTNASADLRAPTTAAAAVGVEAVHNRADPVTGAIAREPAARSRPEAVPAATATPHSALRSKPNPTVGSKAEPAEYPAGDLHNRTGGREALGAALNQDFMPLVSECIDQARQRRPELTGLLVLGVETIAQGDSDGDGDAAHEHGGLIESVEVRPGNEVDDPDLWECVRESALSMDLPPPPDGVGEPFEISLRIDEDD